MDQKISLKILLLILITPLLAVTQNLKEVIYFGENDGNLRMFIHGQNDNLKSKKPLVIVLHGCSQNAKNVAEQSGWNLLADQYNFLVVYPEQKMSNNVTSCFNWFYKKDIDPKSGESSSILEMIAYTLKNFNVDSTQVYIYGLSAGAAMAVNLLANSPTTFNSGASLAGGPYGMAKNFVQAAGAMMNPASRTPQEWGELVPKSTSGKFPRLIVIHGTSDKTVDFQNSTELIKQWTYLHQIDYKDGIVTENFIDNPLIEKTQFVDNNRESKLIFYKIKGVGHFLPVNPGHEVNQGGETGMFAVDCDFFSTYYIAKDFGLISN